MAEISVFRFLNEHYQRNIPQYNKFISIGLTLKNQDWFGFICFELRIEPINAIDVTESKSFTSLTKSVLHIVFHSKYNTYYIAFFFK
jgi:hypothetical protein